MGGPSTDPPASRMGSGPALDQAVIMTTWTRKALLLALSTAAAAGTLASNYYGKDASGEHAEAGVHTDDDKARIDHTNVDVEQYVAAGPSTLHAPQ